MNQLSEHDLELHVKIVGWLHIFGSGLLVLVGLFLLVFLPGIGAVSGDPVAVKVLGFVGPAVFFLMAVIAAPGLVAGFGLLKRKSWSRLLGIVVGVLNLVNFPIGTAIGIYTIWVLMQEQASDYFTMLKSA